MYWYKWRGIDASGKESQGTLYARSKEEIHNNLFKQGVAPFSITPSVSSYIFDALDWFQGTSRELSLLFHQCGLLVESGVPIVQVVELLAEQSSSRLLKKKLFVVAQNLEKGLSFSQSLALFPHVFNAFICSAISAGQKCGALAPVSFLLADYLAQKEAFEKKIRSAAYMPLFTVLFAFLMMGVIVIFIIPQFEMFLSSYEGNRGSTHTFIFSLSRFLRSDKALPVFVGCIVLLVGIRYAVFWKRLAYYKDLCSTYFFALPLRWDALHYCKILALLLRLGVPITQALPRARGVVKNLFFQEHLVDVEQMVLQGADVASSLEKLGTHFFPSRVIALVRVGQKTGNLAFLFEKAAETLRHDINARIGFITMLMQPLLILAVGGIVGFFIITLYGPLFTIAGNVAIS